MAKLLINCKYDDLKGTPLLNEYKIKKLSEKSFTYKIGNEFYSCKLQPKKISNLDVGKVIFLKIEAMRDAINIAIKNNHDQLAEELIKDVLKTADVNLALFLKINAPQYNEAISIITDLVSLLEVEAKIHAFQILEPHCQQDFGALSHFSHALLLKEDADKIIKLLETKLANIDNADLANKDIHVDIGNCYYNLGLAYYIKVDYQAAKKYYLAALEYIPQDQETIFELYKVYLKLNEIDNAKHSMDYLTSKDLKHLLKMSQGLSTISTKGLASINKIAIPTCFHSLIKSYNGLKNQDKIYEQFTW